MLCCAACNLDYGVVYGYASVLWNDDAVRAEALCASDDCAEVVRIGDAVEYHDQKRFAFFVCKIYYILYVAV